MKITIVLKDFYANIAPNIEYYYAKYLKSKIPDVVIEVIPIPYGANKKLKKVDLKQFVVDNYNALKDAEYLYVADAEMFKYLSGQPRMVLNKIFTVLPELLKDVKILSGISYGMLLYDLQGQDKLTKSLQVLVGHIDGDIVPVGGNLLYNTKLFLNPSNSISELALLLHEPRLSLDLETTSLNPFKGVIKSFSLTGACNKTVATLYDKKILKDFLTEYKGKLIFHNAVFDIKWIVYHCWMSSWDDTKGLLEGLGIITRDFEDTYCMAYSAYNSLSKPKLNLKELTVEYTGDYALQDLDNLDKYTDKEILSYNAMDTIATYYLYNKVLALVDSSYESLLKPSIPVIIQTELTGIPMSDKRIVEVKAICESNFNEANKALLDNPYILQARKELARIAHTKDYETRLNKSKTGKIITKSLSTFYDKEDFNPNSDLQVGHLLYKVLDLAVIDLTKSGKPSSAGDTLLKLKNTVIGSAKIAVIDRLLELASLKTIRSTFIPAFEEGILREGGIRYLYGSFILGGTVSGRLSSRNPNLNL
jgi:DNA polymerase-1